jgi:multicomponent Na+:H+ antiporter subunit B
MSPRVRLLVFSIGAAGLAVVLMLGMMGLSPFGESSSPPDRTVGAWLNRVAVPERHLTNVVSAVNFDYRGLDTLGEEYILFAAVAGVALLLRERRGESERDRPEGELERVSQRRSEGVRWSSRWMIGLVNLFGLYVLAHAQLTPGGGFQGGVILGTGSLLVYLGESYRTHRRAVPKAWVDLAGAVGAGGYALVGLAGLLLGGAFLENVLPLGRTGSLLSAGTIPLINVFVGLEVTAGFALLFAEFLEETRQESGRGRS